MQLAEGTIVAERFRLVRLLGRGGMGSVWLAHHLALDIPCAVKLIHPEAARSADLRGRFEREARAAAQIRSPNVVQILDHGVWEDSPYIVMEYLDGEDLEHRLRRLRRLDPREVVSIVHQIARALTKAHAAGLVHRDLKPANIFLVRDDDREIAKVLDFGVAKVSSPSVTDSNTQTGTMLGTPNYMSPEQGQGTRVVDHRSDLWSLGVVVYQCLTGQLPFRSQAFGDLLMKIMTGPIPVPSQVAPVPPGFDAWWFRASAREPAQRFQTAKELAEALALALGISVAGDLGASGALAPLGAPASVSHGPSTPVPGAAPQTAGPVVSLVQGAPGKAPLGARLALLVAGILIAGVLLGVGAFFLSRGPSSRGAAAVATARATAATTTAASPPTTAATTASPAPTAEASAAPSAEPAPTASAAAPVAPTATSSAEAPPAKPASAAKKQPAPPPPAKKRDFGI